MFRPPFIRTGVEVWFEDLVEGLLPKDLSIPKGHADVLERHGLYWDEATQTLVVPDLWVAELLTEDGTFIGQLIFGNPAAVGKPKAIATALVSTPEPFTEDQVIDAYFGGVAPGQERWLWLNKPWPRNFKMRSAAYTNAILQNGTTFTYPIRAFADNGVIQGSSNGNLRVYVVQNDFSRAGYLFIDNVNADQYWYAHPSFLVEKLIPSDGKGFWHFKEHVGPFPNQYLAIDGNPLSQV